MYRILLMFIVLLLFPTPGSCKPFAQIDSLSGKAEVQRAGKHNWQYISKGEKLYSNDVLHVLNKGMALLKWPDGSRSFVHKNSQVLINILQKSPEDNILSHATIFFGTVYFVIRKTISQEISSRITRLYTCSSYIRAGILI